MVTRGVSVGRVVMVDVPGGEVGDRGMIFTHFPRFEPGERAIVFLQQRPDQKWVVTDGELGKLVVDTSGRVEGRNLTVDTYVSELRGLAQ